MSDKVSRRSVFQHATVLGAASAIPVRSLGQLPAGAAYRNLSAAEARTLEAVVARLIPSDATGPGALEAGAVTYIDRALGDALNRYRDVYTRGLAALEQYARATAGAAFAETTPEQQDAMLTALEQNRVEGFEPDSAAFFDLMLTHTREGTFSDPYYGGNRNFIGWDMVGYPGIRLAVGPQEQDMDATLEPTDLSAYGLSMFDEGDA